MTVAGDKEINYDGSVSKPAQKQRSILITLITNIIIFFSFFASSLPTQAEIQITEIMPNPETGSEWVEIYNDSTQSADLSGWKIDDKDGGKTPKTIDALVIGPQQREILSLSDYFNNNCSGAEKNACDRARLFDPKDNDNPENQTDFYPAPAPSGLSWSLQEDGSWCFTNPSPNENNNPCLEPSPTSTPTPTQTASTPTNSPSLTPTQTPTAKAPSPTPTPFAILQINKPKDESGKELDNVKVYLDDVYLHCYAPEELVFCSHCACKTSSGEYGNCDFGHHTIKLVKTGYQDWIKEIEIAAGENQVINPQMKQLSSTPTPTPSPTSLPSPTPTYSSTPSPSPTNQLSPLELGTEEASESTPGLILGAQISSPSPQPTQNPPAVSKNNSSSTIGIILITTGISLAIAPFVFPNLIEKLKSLRNLHEDNR